MKFFIAAVFIFTTTLSAFGQTETEAEVIVPMTFVRKAPNTGGEKLETVQRGERFIVDKKREASGWFYVTATGGRIKGWINANTVRISTVAASVANPVNSAPPANPRPRPSTPPNKTAASSAESPAQLNPPRSRNSEANPVSVKSPNVSAASPAPTPQATPEEPEEIVRVETEEIILNVRVVDGGNRPVKNLDQAQFEIYEDGVLQEITSLTTTEAPVINALLIDNSRSLRSQLSKVIEAGKILAGGSRPQDQTTVVRFISADKIEVVQDFTSNKTSISGALDNLFVEGGQTAIIDAIYKTAQKVSQYQDMGNKNDVKVRAVILVSDGDDRGSSYTEQQLFDLLRSLDVQIYAIGFPNDLSAVPDENGVSRRDKARSFLENLAEETGGKSFFPMSIEELPRIASEITSELRAQYQISYIPTAEGQRGTFKRITVKIADGENKEKRTAVTRAGRTVSP